MKEKKQQFYIKREIEVIGDEHGESFVCVGTKSKRRAVKLIKEEMERYYEGEERLFPKIYDLEISDLWHGYNEDEGMDFYWWGNPPKHAKYLGKCWRYDVYIHE